MSDWEEMMRPYPEHTGTTACFLCGLGTLCDLLNELNTAAGETHMSFLSFLLIIRIVFVFLFFAVEYTVSSRTVFVYCFIGNIILPGILKKV